MEICLRSLICEGATDYGALTWRNDLATSVLDMRLEIKPEKRDVAVGAVRRAVCARCPLVIL